MDIGIDFGTTRTVVAFADRGNYPVVRFTDEADDAYSYFPSLVACVDGALVSGFAARDAITRALPSFKRILSRPDVTPDTPVEVSGQRFTILEVLSTYLADLRRALSEQSSISHLLADDPITRVMVAVPAHAHSAQRYITLEAFRQAGFHVTAMMNEPSAAGFEFTHRQKASAKRTHLLIYDLGGGTFDASLISIHDRDHAVVNTTGMNHLGGDDFDVIIADMAAQQVGFDPNSDVEAYFDLLAEAQAAKEALVPQSRRMIVEVGDETVVIGVPDFYERCAPLVEQTMGWLDELVDQVETDHEIESSQLQGIYLVGGATNLPIVPRLLKERYGRKIFRSNHAGASTAIGLAIAAHPESGFALTDRLSRGFGVYREADGGARVQFDPIFLKSQSLDQPVRVGRRYRAAHTVGHFRFMEFNTIVDGQPVGNQAPLPFIRFPFSPELQHDGVDLTAEPVRRTQMGDLIEEQYVIDTNGIVSVTITDVESGYSITRQLGQMNP